MTERTRWLKDLLWVLALAGALGIGFRLWFGLGATTNLTDSVPWGLWKILNMVAGVAVATGGFTVGFLVYVLRIERIRPLVRPAILIAFLGYGSSVFALLLDIGLPYRIWHPIVMWNERSFLFEVAWCVMLYFTVTMIELSPTVLERVRATRLAEVLHRIAPGVVIVGIALSSLHHSSLGSLFLVTPLRLHELWYSSLLPLQFIVSAIGGGLMMVVLVRILYARLYRGSAAALGDSDLRMLRSLAVVAGGVLTVYLAVKATSLTLDGTWHSLLAGTWESWLWALELACAAVVPLLLLASRRVRSSPSGLAAASSFAVAGLVWNRLDVGIFGYFRDAGEIYLPSRVEWAVSLGVLAAAGLAFLFAVENFPIFDAEWRRRREARLRFVPAFDHVSRVWSAALGRGPDRISLLAVFTLALGWLVLYPPYRADPRRPAEPVSPPTGADAARATLRIDADRTGMAVVFPHRDHQQRLEKEGSCGECHHLSLPGDHSTPCSRCHREMERETDIFDPTLHLAAVAEHEDLCGWVPENRTCGQCHDPARARGAESAKACLECHREDMEPTREVADPRGLRFASGFRPAMHGTCIACHERKREAVDRAGLADCSTCHEELRGRSRELPEGVVLRGRPSHEPHREDDVARAAGNPDGQEGRHADRAG
jgi:Ni/Fe-hydrogenase subunit HybB-like protein